MCRRCPRAWPPRIRCAPGSPPRRPEILGGEIDLDPVGHPIRAEIRLDTYRHRPEHPVNRSAPPLTVAMATSDQAWEDRHVPIRRPEPRSLWSTRTPLDGRWQLGSGAGTEHHDRGAPIAGDLPVQEAFMRLGDRGTPRTPR